MTRTLVIASGNAGKAMEFHRLLQGWPVTVVPQPTGLEVDENGSTFAENARIKARTVARLCGHWALADDSGLCVDALDGAPGVRSARYASTDEARISRLLEELSVREQQSPLGPGRTARFVAALSVADPEGRTLAEAEGRRSGVIIRSPRGQGGFGYDPIFLAPELNLTFAEMSAGQKRSHSHRGRAVRALLPRLRDCLEPSCHAGREESPEGEGAPPAH